MHAHPIVKWGVPVLAVLQAVLIFSNVAEPIGIAAGHGAEIFWSFLLALWVASRRYETPVTPFLIALAAGALAAGATAMCVKILWSSDYLAFYLADRDGRNDFMLLSSNNHLFVIAGWYLFFALLAVPGGLFLGRFWRKFRG